MLTPTTESSIDDISRRGLLVTTFTAAFLAACGEDRKEGTAEPAATTRTVDTHLGPVNVPVRPERIVVFDRRGTLALQEVAGALHDALLDVAHAQSQEGRDVDPELVRVGAAHRKDGHVDARGLRRPERPGHDRR